MDQHHKQQTEDSPETLIQTSSDRDVPSITPRQFGLSPTATTTMELVRADPAPPGRSMKDVNEEHELICSTRAVTENMTMGEWLHKN